ncbi:unnamed protein product [Heterobilharzia americana]|nr:unnamed protein product [Heterobilharzia americana]
MKSYRLCQTDPRSTPLLSRLLAPGFATSVVSSTNNTNSSQRKGNNQSYESSEGDRSPVPSSSSAQGFLTEVNRQEVGLKDRILSQDVASSDKYQKKDSENVSWNLPSSSTHVQSTSREWRELSDWSGKRETIVQSKSRSPNFQPSPDSQCWRTVTSVQIKNENMLPEQSSSNTCSSGTQDEMESSVGSPGIFNRNQCDVESNNHAKMFGKGGGFLTNASSSGDLDDGGVDDDHAIHQTLPNEDIESNTHSDDHDDNDDEDVEDNIDNTDHDTTLPRDNEETVTIPLNHNNCNDDNNNSVTMMMMIHRTSHSYVNESEELFAVHEQQERQRQQQQEKVDYHHHHHQQQQQLDSKPSHLVSPNALQEPCDFEEGYPEYPNDISERTSNVDSRFIMPQPPPPPPPPYRIPDHFQPVDESVFNNNHPWIPPNYPYLYPQIPYPHYQHRFQSEKLHPMGQFVTSSVALTKSPALPVFDNPYDLLYMKQNYLPESLHRPPHPGALIPRRAICPQNQEGPPGIMKDDAFPPFTAISQALGFPIQWCYRGVCMLPRFPVTSASFTNLPVSCAAAAFVLTTTTSHICSLAAYGYNVCGRNNNQNQQFIGNYQPDICSVHIAGPYGKPELFSTSKSHIVLDTGLGGVKNLSELDIANLVKENQQLKQRLIDINIRLQYIDELEWHVQRLSLLVESMIVSHQRQCELDYQLQIYSPVSAPGGVVDSDGCKPRPPPPPNSLSLASSFGLTDQCPINQFHNMPANPGSLPAMPTNMTNCRAHAYTRQNVTRRVTQPNIIPPRFRSPHIIQPTQQLEKSEQRIHMANSTKRSLYPHSVASMNPRTVSLIEHHCRETRVQHLMILIVVV